MAYDAFVSYSHAADGLLAPRLQAGLQRFAKPWWKRRAIRVFRDESSLSANPHLWSSITDALDESEWFVLLLSPDAAASPWVNDEIAYWLEHKRPERIIPVVTDGQYVWNGNDDASPPAIAGVFADEPRWVDLRNMRTDEHLDLKNPDFSAAIADIASAIHGIPKDELASEEVKQHRRTVRTAWAAGTVLILLGIAATMGAVVAVNQSSEAQAQRDEAQRLASRESEARDDADDAAEAAAESAAEAIRQSQRATEEADAARIAESHALEQSQLARSRELAASATAAVDVDSELAMMLALQSIEATPGGQQPSPAAVIAMRDSIQSNRLITRFGENSDPDVARIAPDGSVVYFIVANNTAVVALEASSGTEIWRYEPLTVDPLVHIDVSPDGKLLSVALVDFLRPDPNQDVPVDESGHDAHPARVVVLDAATGATERIIEPGDCPIAQTFQGGFSPDGRWLTVQTGNSACPSTPDSTWLSVISTASWEEETRLTLDGALFEHASFSADSTKLLLNDQEGGTVLYAFPGLEVINVLPDSRDARLSPDGSYVLLTPVASGLRPALVDADSGQLVSHLDPVEGFVTQEGLRFTNDQRLITVATRTRDYVFDAQDGRLLFELGSNGGAISQSLSSDGTRLLVSNGVTVTLWDLSNEIGNVGSPLDVPGQPFWINPETALDGPSLAVRVLTDNGPPDLGCCGEAIAVLDSETFSTIGHVAGRGAQLSDGRFVVARVSSGPVDWTHGPLSVWDVDEGSFTDISHCSVEEAEIRSGAELTCSDLLFWTGRPVIVNSNASLILAQSYAPFGSPSVVRIWRSSDLEIVGEIDIDREQNVAVAGVNWIATTSNSDPVLRILNSATGETIAEFETNARLASLSPDGSVLFAPDWFGGMTVIDTTTWTTRVQWKAHDAAIRGTAVSPDGSLLVTTGEDNFVRVWDNADLEEGARNETPTLIDRIPATFPSDAVWLDSDRLLVFLANRAEWLEVSLGIDDLVVSARERITRGFDPLECQTYELDSCPTLAEIRAG